jgi:nucleotide-binding universal stress UspA family protein
VLRYRHVLIAFDGSPGAELALAHAVAMAHAFRARLCIVAVGRRLAWDSQDLEARLRTAADGVPDDLSVTTRVLTGDPVAELLKAARAGEHDLIVVGSGVFNQVTQDAEVPVIVVHRPSDGPDLAA